MFSRALTQAGPVRGLAVAVAATFVALTSAAPPAQPTHHNARVAEYLLFQHRDAHVHNARVAEYLLLQHRDTGH